MICVHEREPTTERLLEDRLDALLAQPLKQTEQYLHTECESLEDINCSVTHENDELMTAKHELAEHPDFDIAFVISPFSSASDLSTYSGDDEYSTFSEGDLLDDRVPCDHNIRTELTVSWHGRRCCSEPSIKTELSMLWYGYPMVRPETPELINMADRKIIARKEVGLHNQVIKCDHLALICLLCICSSLALSSPFGFEMI